MRWIRVCVTSVVVAATASTITPSTAGGYSRPGKTERISVSSRGVQGNGDSSGQLAMTPDGRFVAFVSSAKNLVHGDTNNAPDVFLRDRLLKTTRLVSVAYDGGPATSVPPSTTCGANKPSISDNGRFVAFESCFTNHLAPTDAGLPSDTNHTTDVFVRDMELNSTVRASVTNGGDQTPLAFPSTEATISGDGRLVVFQSAAKTLTASVCPSDPVQKALCQAGGYFDHIFVRDLVKRTTTLVSASSSGEPGDAKSLDASISRDGRYVAFTSAADNLVGDDLNSCNPAYGLPSCPDIFVKDLRTGAIEIATKDLAGNSARDESGRTATTIVQGISADGRYVAFRSDAPHLVPNDGPTAAVLKPTGIYVRDRLLHRTERASVSSSGAIVPLGQHLYGISPDGRYVAVQGIRAASCGLNAGVVGVHDRVTGDMDDIGATDLKGNQDCQAPYAHDGQISAGGRFVCFYSAATNLVAYDSNKSVDVFVRDRGPAVGTGRMTVASLGLTGNPSFSRSGIATVSDGAGDVSDVLSAEGADLIGVRLVNRPWLHDLFVNVDLAQMPVVTTAPSRVAYTVALVTGAGRDFELRIAKLGPVAEFVLFEKTATGWQRLGDVPGGFGTTGQAVVAAIPTADLGLTSGGTIRRAAVSSHLASVGPLGLQSLDEVILGSAA